MFIMRILAQIMFTHVSLQIKIGFSIGHTAQTEITVMSHRIADSDAYDS